ncbi:DEAD/DEAH box helicase [Micromonospora sp. WMMA1949]|uniref:DEAD/DEAH box helicase n=1 Tax=Micromonospora sp. WMMA1949 TaxID=3015162 RepID=UPI0022B60F86|nr:DEAD/DEAH box helicase [Micromonospora sp. WMMA1949]MCZ7425487.1 DEAD/DEAH box helicase [Micromonospora sp. WMMA1949]
MIRTRGFELAAWQADAVEAWVGDVGGRYRGTLEIVTGGGKTLIALACAARAAERDPRLRLVVVVPTEALARQWRAMLERFTSLEESDIGLLGAGHSAELSRCRALVAVLNTAAKQLPAAARVAQPLMLVIDECHRAGAPTFSQVLQTEAAYRLGLSATPDREELDDAGQPLRYDEQLVGQRLGPVVYRYTLRNARVDGWLPDYEIHHHGIQLTDGERHEYEKISRQVDDLADELRSLGFEPGRVQQLQRRGGEVASVARTYIAVTSRRKDLLYRAAERSRVAHRIIEDSLAAGKTRRVLLFHERVDEAKHLYERLQKDLRDSSIALEHSRLGTRTRTAALDAFRDGRAQILVSVKSLVEGIDVPEADLGISVAATSSVRQRIQALGRVLRRRFDSPAETKHAEMHLIYVAGTVDEQIYAKEDWADLTGDGSNHYWRWPREPAQAKERMPGPPATPRPTEQQEWERLGRRAPGTPVEWHGVFSGQEYSVDTLGTVTNVSGALIRNPQHVASLVELVRGRPGGRFRITSTHRLVLVWGDGPAGAVPYVAGQLADGFEAEPRDAAPTEAVADPSKMVPGMPLHGPVDKEGGAFHFRQKRGGVIERRLPGGVTEFARTDAAAPADLVENAQRALDGWRRLFDRGISFFVSSEGQAWYVADSRRYFLAYVPGGFSWPS